MCFFPQHSTPSIPMCCYNFCIIINKTKGNPVWFCQWYGFVVCQVLPSITLIIYMVHVLLGFVEVYYKLIIPLSIRVISLALVELYNCPSFTETTLNHMGKCKSTRSYYIITTIQLRYKKYACYQFRYKKYACYMDDWYCIMLQGELMLLKNWINSCIYSHPILLLVLCRNGRVEPI